MVLIFYDLETTGFSKEHNDIIEIAAIAYDTVEEELDTFSTYIKPTTRIPQVITDLTGISNAMVANCMHYWDAAPTFFAWLMQYNPDAMVGYNNSVFDAKFISAQNLRYKLNFDWDNFKQIDVLKIVRALKKPGKPLSGLKDAKQTTVAKFFGIDYDAHDAIEDVRALVEIYKHLKKLDPSLL